MADDEVKVPPKNWLMGGGISAAGLLAAASILNTKIDSAVDRMLEAEVQSRMDLQELSFSVQRNTIALDALMKNVDDRWRFSQMKGWVEVLQALNPNVDVPPIR